MAASPESINTGPRRTSFAGDYGPRAPSLHSGPGVTAACAAGFRYRGMNCAYLVKPESPASRKVASAQPAIL
jgi:hypothetical protein